MHTPQSLLEALQALNIPFTNHHHQPVFTVEESQTVTNHLPGAHIKNLFVKDKSHKLFLITALHERSLSLKLLGKHLGAKDNLSFANPEILMQTLGVTPGSVSPLALINAPAGSLTFVLDEPILSHPLVNPHPLINSQTTALTPQHLIQATTHWGHPPLLLNLALFPRP